MVPDEVEQEDRARDEDTSLKASARGDVPERLEPDPDEETAADHDHPDEPHGIAGQPSRVPLRPPRACVVAEQQRHADDRGVEDELLPHGVDGAHVEVRPHDDVRRVAQRHDDAVEDEAVGAVVVAERRHSGDGPGEERREAGQRGREDADPDAPAHCSPRSFLRSWRRERAIAARMTSG